MEPKDPISLDIFEEFDFDIHDPEGRDLEGMYVEAVKGINSFYQKYAADGEHTKDDFYDLMRGVTPSRSLLHVAMAAREVNSVLESKELDRDDLWVLNEVWYDSFLQCADIAILTEDMNDEQLKQLRSFACKKLIEITDVESSHDANFTHYVNALNWYCHVVIGTSVLIGDKAEDAADNLHTEIEKNQMGKRTLEHFEFAGHNLFKDKVKIHGDTEEIRPRARYVAEGLEEDAEAAAKAFLATSYLNVLLSELSRCGDDYSDRWRSFTELARGFANDFATEHTDQAESIDLEKFKPMELDWEVLPPGKLQDAAREIAESVSDQEHEVEIDLERLKSLELIRTQWGADRCFYAKGALKSRRTRRNADKQCPDQYILLVLQETESEGKMIEHVVAESPIAGPHAMYLFRQDVNPNSHWRTVMSMFKPDAQKHGARPIKHPSLEDKSELPANMAERVATLLAATPDEFKRLEFRGERFVLRSKLAIKAFQALIPANVS